MRKGFAPGQLDNLSTEADTPSSWDGTGWSYEGYRDGADGEWRIVAFTVDSEPAARLDMRFGSWFTAEEVAGLIAEQIGWHEDGPPPDDRTDYEAIAVREKEAKSAAFERMIRGQVDG